MADQFMSQEEIESLLSGAEALEENVEKSKTELDPVDFESFRTAEKILKGKARNMDYFPPKYQSPVIKSSRVVYNPKKKIESDANVTAVFSLAMFAAK